MTDTSEMPRFTSYKTVHALQIDTYPIERHSDGSVTLPIADVGFTAGKITVDAKVVDRYMPVAGDFLVIYADGYQSISPRKAFVEGYVMEGEEVPEPSDIENIAKVCHEINRAYCASIGDHSQPAWADAPEWQRNSAINGVNFSIQNPEAPPSASHESWLAEKAADGWKYGAVKNPEAKEHPCFVPYDQLPVEQRTKDYLFQAVVRALA